MKMFSTCDLTVAGEMERVRAISLSTRPCAIRWRISRSRPVSVCGPCRRGAAIVCAAAGSSAFTAGGSSAPSSGSKAVTTSATFALLIKCPGSLRPRSLGDEARAEPARNQERERRARAVVERGLEGAAMILDDPAADEEPDARAVALGRIEGIEEPLRLAGPEAFACIPHAQPHMALEALCADHQLPRTVVDLVHRFRGVRHEVEDHLLELQGIPGDSRKIGLQFAARDHPTQLELLR